MGATKQVILSESERIELEEYIRVNRDFKINRRLISFRMLDQGSSRQDIINVFGISYQSIIRWVDIYEEFGLPGLLVLHYDGRRPSALEPYEQDLLTFSKENVVTCIDQIVDFVNNVLQIPLGYDAVRAFVKKNSILLPSNQRKFHLRKQKKSSKKSLSNK